METPRLLYPKGREMWHRVVCGITAWYTFAMSRTTTITEANILDQIVSAKETKLRPDVARAFLQYDFDASTRKRIRQLLRKNNRGTISPTERLTLEKYVRVGQFLDLLHAKAKLTLANHESIGD
jgi:hypothetical protein